MYRTNRVVVLGRGPGRAAAAASFLGGPGVILISETDPKDPATPAGSAWTVMMRDLRRLEVDVTRFRPGNDPDEVPLARHVTVDPVVSADVLLVDTSLPPDVVRAALYHARGTVVLEPGPSLNWLTTLAPFVHLLVLTPAGLGALVDETTDGDRAQVLTGRLQVPAVVLLAPDRALIVRPGQEPQLVEAPTAGTATPLIPRAEECFRGVLAARLAVKSSLPDAVLTALTASALLAGRSAADGSVAGWPSPRDLTTST
ncbi:carbohydrate kinase family protein [Kineosporia succinea]|uniref:Sugar/nucleoside kinase (Ribokinase family) n=1 Tax=Kineosporia succinea TaxID=84632 RepID=A0ABT9PC35_9ACTN|nr:hypothetical protein [Kineosporia succinea]MDP9830269.1 sugar/nucleoside kinase (ribokinase family) [Kineosporia succinea]